MTTDKLFKWDSGQQDNSAKLVTNGDAHDHSGGDGAQIDHGGLAGLADDDHAQYLKADGSRAVNGDLRVAGGVVVGNGGANDPGNGEIWLQEQSVYPAATGSVNKLINYKNRPFYVNKNGLKSRADSVDLLTPYLQYPFLRGFWYGYFSIKTSSYAWTDRIGNKDMLVAGNITPGAVSFNDLYPVGYVQQTGGGSGDYVYAPTASDFNADNWIAAVGWFYTLSISTVVRPLVALGSTTLSWRLYDYNNYVQALLYNTSGAPYSTPAVALIPNAWNFLGFSFYWAAAGNYMFKSYANGVWSSNSATDPGSPARTPAGDLRLFNDGTNWTPEAFRISSLLLGIQATSGAYANAIEYIYESTKAFYGQ